MTAHIGLLRAVNLAGRNRVAMSDLRDFLIGLGFTDPRTLLQSGNAVFGGGARSTAQLERLLEAESERTLGFGVDFFVRTLTEWNDVIARNPFPQEAERDPGHLLVMFLKAAPEAGNVKALQKAIVGSETLRADGRQLYIVYPDGVGRSRLNSSLIERHLGTRGTGRNWNTVLKLGAMAGETKQPQSMKTSQSNT
jgi:uncharacterized protein (DUF1697 family)